MNVLIDEQLNLVVLLLPLTLPSSVNLRLVPLFTFTFLIPLIHSELLGAVNWLVELLLLTTLL